MIVHKKYVVTQRWFDQTTYWTGHVFRTVGKKHKSLSRGRAMFCTANVASTIARELKRDGYRNVSIAKPNLWQRIKLEISQ